VPLFVFLLFVGVINRIERKTNYGICEISPFAPRERGITLAYKVWNEMSFVKDAEEDER
jgi:hypothetical protein